VYIHPSSMLPYFVLGVKYIALLGQQGASKSKIRPNFAIFDPRAKNRGVVGKVTRS